MQNDKNSENKQNKKCTKILITVYEEILEQVEEYSYLRSTFDENDRCIKEVRKRIGMAKTVFCKSKEILGRNLSMDMKRRILDCHMKSVLMYGNKTWTMTKEIINRIDVFQLWCYKRMPKVRYTYHVTNKKVKEILRLKNNKWSEDIAKRKMRFAGHIMRGSSGGLIQVVLEGMIDGKRTRERQRKIW